MFESCSLLGRGLLGWSGFRVSYIVVRKVAGRSRYLQLLDVECADFEMACSLRRCVFQKKVLGLDKSETIRVLELCHRIWRSEYPSRRRGRELYSLRPTFVEQTTLWGLRNRVWV